MASEIPVLPVGTAGQVVYVNVVQNAKMRTAMAMESVKPDVKIHIMVNVVMFPVLRRTVKDVIKCLATVQSALKDCMELIVLKNAVSRVWEPPVI